MDLTAGSRKFLNTSNNSLLNGRRLSGRNTRGVRGGKSAGRAVGSAAAAAAAANGAGAAVRSKKAILALRDDEDDAQVFRAAAGRETEEEGVVAPTPTPAATAAEEETGKRLQEQEKSNGDVSTLEPDAMADGITNQGVPAPKGRKAGQRRRTRVVAYL